MITVEQVARLICRHVDGDEDAWGEFRPAAQDVLALVLGHSCNYCNSPISADRTGIYCCDNCGFADAQAAAGEPA